MKFPSKVTPYKESIVAIFPVVLTILEKGPISPSALFAIIRKSRKIGIQEFTDVLDCLYSLNKIELREGVLYYAE